MNLVLLFEEDFVGDPGKRRVVLEGRRLEHILSVHKAVEGDSLRVGLLNGKTGNGLIRSISAESIEMDVDFSGDPPDPLPATIILAMPRPKALKRIIQHCTTLGVKRIYIIKTWRVEKSFWESPVLKEENLFHEMVLGLEQARDTVLPLIEIRKLFKPFAEDELPGIINGTRALVAHPGSEKECPRFINEPVTLAVGPEGGFIPYEIEMLEKQGFEAVSVGERILRVETALPAILGRLY
ncbi:MAG: 16S rRNA (uracil(1498)-N(3))-methyltransferase [bacterium]|nr:16S rRNA (uracil(1498)-N(3))-methyltransferase [bacterium]